MRSLNEWMNEWMNEWKSFLVNNKKNTININNTQQKNQYNNNITIIYDNKTLAEFTLAIIAFDFTFDIMSKANVENVKVVSNIEDGIEWE